MSFPANSRPSRAPTLLASRFGAAVFLNLFVSFGQKMDKKCVKTEQRSRGDNWSQDEKDLFLEVMRHSAPIIENKQTDTNTNKRKTLEWKSIQSKLKELTGKERDVPQLKGFWRRSKIAAKKSVALHRSALRATGGGEKPRSPPPTDQIIMDMCPTDFVEDQNQFDSDSAQNKTAVVDEENHDGIILYDIDIDPNEIDIKSCGKEGKSSNIFKPPPSKIKKPEIKEKEKYPRDNTSKADLIATTITIKKRAMQLMEEEFALKIEYQHKELAHQQLRHKLEIDILLAEKTKKQLENEILKKKLQD